MWEVAKEEIMVENIFNNRIIERKIKIMERFT
jgi:hypothetical protein